MDWIQALVLGIVQGLTEFLPISSTAHLRIIPHLLDWQDPGTEYSAVIQLGTLLAVMLYFWNDVVSLSRAALVSLWKRNLFETSDSKLAWSIAAGTIPVVIAGLGFKDIIKTDARQLWLIGTALIILAIGLYAAEKLSHLNREICELKFLQIQLIGLTQALALIPGCSRSGSTIMGGLIVGLKREEAARFFFFTRHTCYFRQRYLRISRTVGDRDQQHRLLELDCGGFCIICCRLSLNRIFTSFP